MNENQYFVGSDTSFRIFDLRNHLEIDKVDSFANSIEMFNDYNNFITFFEQEATVTSFLYGKTKILTSYNFQGLISSLSISDYRKDKNVIAVGCNNGEMLYSVLK